MDWCVCARAHAQVWPGLGGWAGGRSKESSQSDLSFDFQLRSISLVCRIFRAPNS